MPLIMYVSVAWVYTSKVDCPSCLLDILYVFTSIQMYSACIYFFISWKLVQVPVTREKTELERAKNSRNIFPNT